MTSIGTIQSNGRVEHFGAKSKKNCNKPQALFFTPKDSAVQVEATLKTIFCICVVIIMTHIFPFNFFMVVHVFARRGTHNRACYIEIIEIINNRER
jgi:hypothetical protein